MGRIARLLACTLLALPASAQVPENVDQPSFAEGTVRCELDDTDAGRPLPLAGRPAEYPGHGCASATAEAATEVGVASVADVPAAPSVSVFTAGRIGETPGPPPAADIAWSYNAEVVTSPGAPALPAHFAVPLAVAASLQVETAPEPVQVGENAFLLNGFARGSAAVSFGHLGASGLFALDATAAPNELATIGVARASAEFDGVVLAARDRNIDVELSARCSSRSSEGPPKTCFATAVASIAVDVEALRAELEELGVEHPAPADLFELRFNPDLEAVPGIPLPEPAGGRTAALLALSLWSRLGRTRAPLRTACAGRHEAAASGWTSL
ncbi:MAG: hypothetical protein QNK03_24935, partial [Myxococcota bacterium]|nr:hypothetical protein [Myxococcota bacterium]